MAMALAMAIGHGHDTGQDHGPMGHWLIGLSPMGPWAYGPMGPWAHGPWAHGPMDPWVHGESDLVKVCVKGCLKQKRTSKVKVWGVFRTNSS